MPMDCFFCFEPTETLMGPCEHACCPDCLAKVYFSRGTHLHALACPVCQPQGSPAFYAALVQALRSHATELPAPLPSAPSGSPPALGWVCGAALQQAEGHCAAAGQGQQAAALRTAARVAARREEGGPGGCCLECAYEGAEGAAPNDPPTAVAAAPGGQGPGVLSGTSSGSVPPGGSAYCKLCPNPTCDALVVHFRERNSCHASVTCNHCHLSFCYLCLCSSRECASGQHFCPPYCSDVCDCAHESSTPETEVADFQARHTAAVAAVQADHPTWPGPRRSKVPFSFKAIDEGTQDCHCCVDGVHKPTVTVLCGACGEQVCRSCHAAQGPEGPVPHVHAEGSAAGGSGSTL